MNRRMKLIFTISVLVNIVLIGAGAGMLYRFCNDRFDIPGDMSPEARHFIAMTFEQGREQVKPLITEVKSRRAKVEDIITADKFDLKAYTKATDSMLETRDKISRKRAEIMGKTLVDLPAADRQKFADRILDGLGGNRPPHGGLHGKMGKDGPPAKAKAPRPPKD